AAGRAALHTKAGPKRGLAQTAHGLLADAVEAVPKPDRRRGLALAGRGRADGGHQDELAVVVLLRRVDEIERNLGLVRTVVEQRIGGNGDLFADLRDRLHLCLARDFDIRLYGHDFPSTEFARVLKI